MTTTLRTTEALPAAYPATPSGLSVAAAALSPAMIWQRIEAYIAVRWTSRAVTWLVEGPGEWVPPLTPATIATKEPWTGTAWEAFTPRASPAGGYMLDCEKLYRFTGTVGSGTVPEAVNEAFRRLAEYMAAGDDHHGATAFTANVGPVSISQSRNASWQARAMSNCGAGDLLRPYRGLS